MRGYIEDPANFDERNYKDVPHHTNIKADFVVKREKVEADDSRRAAEKGAVERRKLRQEAEAAAKVIEDAKLEERR